MIFEHYSLQSVYFHQKSLLPLPMLNYHSSITLLWEELPTLRATLFMEKLLTLRVTLFPEKLPTLRVTQTSGKILFHNNVEFSL